MFENWYDLPTGQVVFRLTKNLFVDFTLNLQI